MNLLQKTVVSITVLSLYGCGGGSSSSSDTVIAGVGTPTPTPTPTPYTPTPTPTPTPYTPTPTPTPTPYTPTPTPTPYTPTPTPTPTPTTLPDPDTTIDAYEYYTGKVDRVALDAGNVGIYTSMLFDDDLSAPAQPFVAKNAQDDLVLSGKAFLRSQQDLLSHLRLQAKAKTAGLQAKTVNQDSRCDNDGSFNLYGDLTDTVDKSKFNLNFSNCLLGDVLYDGAAAYFIYAYDSTMSQTTSSRISYNGTLVSSANKTQVATGTVDEVIDLDANTTRVTAKLHQLNQADSVQTLIDTTSYDYGSNNEVDGLLYHETLGSVEVLTKTLLTYHADNSIKSGEIRLLGADDSEMSITAN